MELGPVRSVHRAKITSLVWLVLLAAFCFAFVVAVIVMPFGHHAHQEAWKRWGLGALFLAGGAMLIGYAAWMGRTTVELCDGGLRYVRGAATAVAWADLQRVELVRINGRLRSAIVYARGRRLAMTAVLRGFDDLVAALHDHAPPAEPSVPRARAL